MADRVQPVAIPAPVAELVSAWNDRSADRFVAVLAPDVHLAVPPLHLQLDGRDEVWLGISRLFGAFGALRYTSRHRYLSDDGVTDEALLEGLQTQEFLGAPPTGQPGAVAARVMMRHDGYVLTRLVVWPDVAALRNVFDGAARRIDLRTAGPAAPVVAALRATIPASTSKLSLSQHRQLPATALVDGDASPAGGPNAAAGAAAPAGHGGRQGDQEPGRGRKGPKAPLPRKVRRLRAVLAGIAMLAVAGLLVTYVVEGVRDKREPAAAATTAKPKPTAGHRAQPGPKPSPSSHAATTQPTFDAVKNQYSIPNTVLFQVNSSRLRPDALATLDVVVNRVLADKRYGKITVNGYTDSTGSAGLNARLSRNRAATVADYLRSKLPPEHFTVVPIGRGATGFVAGNDTARGRQQNRRVEIKVPPKMTG